MILTLDETKKFIGIEIDDTDYDDEILALIKDGESMLYSVLGVDGFEKQTKEEWGFWDPEEKTITLKNFPIVEIKGIGGEVYSGEENKDFILNGRVIEFINIPPAEVIRNKILTKYKFGYEPVMEESGEPDIESQAPGDIKLAIKYLVSGLWNTKKEVGIVSSKIGQESFNFASITDQEDFKKILAKLKKDGVVFIL